MKKSDLHQALDDLLNALDAVRPGSSDKLAPGLPEATIRQRCLVDGFDPPDEWVQLLTWRDGSPLDVAVFRDHSMLGLEAALASKAEIDQLCESIPELGVPSGELVPFGVCEGHFLVLWPKDDQVPVFQLGEGVEPFGISLEAWILTCADWLEHPKYDASANSLPSSVEGEIWQRRNPGLEDLEVGFSSDFFDESDFDSDDEDLDDDYEGGGNGGDDDDYGDDDGDEDDY